MAGMVTVTGLSSSNPAGQLTLGPLSIPGTSGSLGELLALPLALGDNVITVPPLMSGVILVPPIISSITLTYRTNLNSADAGLPISALAPFMHLFPPVIPTSLIIHASAAQASPLSYWLW